MGATQHLGIKFGSYDKTIASLIATHKAPRHSTEPAAVMEHANLRGPGYFH